MEGKKIIYVGLSGGVDSSVAALLLIEQDFDVVGIFMKNWSDCDWISEERWAKNVAAHLGIPCETWDFEKEYRELVIKNFFGEYKIGRTPNPDVLCNKFIKFDIFLRKAIESGGEGIATGHYAKIENGRLVKGKDSDKDQSYFLYALTAEQLSHVRFPLGDLEKSRVREIAENAGLPNYAKLDSQGICFVGQVKVKSFLEQELPKTQGNIIDESGKCVGTHDGIHFYTEGQREGLYLGGMEHPHYIALKDVDSNTLVVAKKDSPLHYADTVIIKDMHHIRDEISGYLKGKVRYRQDDQDVLVEREQGAYKLTFKEPQFALSKGQSVVLYRGQECLGGGIVDDVIHPKGLVENLKMKLNIST